MRACLSSLLTDSTFTGRSQRSKEALEQVKHLLDKISEESNLDSYDEFSLRLLQALEKVYSTALSSTGRLREQLWRQFHAIRLTELSDIWKQFLDGLKFHLDPLVQQYVNQELFSSMVKSRCGSCSTVATKAASMTKEEENIVRYASGYVPYSLMKKHERNVTEKSAFFVECLSSMAVNGEEESFLEYTREWSSKVNRGGLFEINDTSFTVFREIELCIRDKLSSTLASFTAHPGTKDQLVKEAFEDSDVQFYWSLLSTDIEDLSDADELLKEIVELWLTIRGFSIAGQWMEMYKKKSMKTTKKNKGLCKTLKRTAESSTSKKAMETALKETLKQPHECDN